MLSDNEIEINISLHKNIKIFYCQKRNIVNNILMEGIMSHYHKKMSQTKNQFILNRLCFFFAFCLKFYMKKQYVI